MRKGGPPVSPKKLNQFLGVDVLEWYHPGVSSRQEKKTAEGLATRDYVI
jgi:hypothetical protein